MTKYYIFRHGETFVTQGKALSYGFRIFSADILDEGKDSIRRMGKHLKEVKTDFNVSSRFKRCQQTVNIVSEISGKQFVFDWRLNEPIFELPFMVKKRVKNFLELIERKRYKSVLICTHGAVINELIRCINPKAFVSLSRKKPGPRPPLQIEANRNQLSINKLRFTKYLSPGVLLILTKNTTKEIDFNR